MPKGNVLLRKAFVGMQKEVPDNLTTFISNDDQKGHWRDLNIEGKMMKIWKEDNL